MIKTILKNNWAALSVILLLSAIAIATGLNHQIDFDESQHHLKAIQQYIEQAPMFDLQSYHSASGPLPYVIWSVWGSILGDSIASLRLLTLFFAFGCIFIILSLLRDQPFKIKVLVLLLSTIQPYFISRSLSIYTMIPSLFMGLSALLAYIRYLESKKTAWLVAYSLFAVCALFSRQIYLSYIAGISLHFLLYSIRQNRAIFKKSTLIAFGMPVLLFGMLLIYWGGGNPPGFSGNASKGINLAQLDFSLIFLGFWFWPVAYDYLKKLPRWLLIVAGILALHMFVVPLYVSSENATKLVDNTISGIIPRIFETLIIAGIPTLVIAAIEAVLWAIGVLIFYIILQQLNHVCSWIIIFHIAILLLVPQVWERYYFPIIPIIWFVLVRNIKTNKIYALQLALQTGIVAMYLFQKVL